MPITKQSLTESLEILESTIDQAPLFGEAKIQAEQAVATLKEFIDNTIN